MSHNCAIPKCDRTTRQQICRPCADELHDMLRALVAGEIDRSGRQRPGWLDYLDDACSGQTKLGAQARHITEHDAPLPVNFNANALQRRTAETIVSWAIVLRASTVAYRPGMFPQQDPKLAATWIADNIEAVAYHEHVAQLHADIKRTTSAIKRAIDYRQPPRYCGPCIAPHPDAPDLRCDREITVHRRAKTARCPRCKTEHQVAELIRENLAGMEHWHFRAHELLRILDSFEVRVSKTTFYRWRREGKLLPSQYDTDDKPMFLFADVQKLIEQNTTKRTSNTPIQTTGA
ncbi:hypothetical protein NM962_01265 [Mycobacterium sp. SVM_VP21]|nr:hypothetical protein NM962_01265 [Mycobacterium sp. SVM_VP21]